mmetsp:Transcript_6476/g.15765  ORF Transcript_6476/g.15765 Transcript_6476/m.15765 type:complete len:695 (-) Transcript_6476:53-2137(-)
MATAKMADGHAKVTDRLSTMSPRQIEHFYLGDDEEAEERIEPNEFGEEKGSAGPTLVEKWEEERYELEASKVRFLRVVQDQRQVEETVRVLLDKLGQMPEEMSEEMSAEQPDAAQWTPSQDALGGEDPVANLVSSRVAEIEQRAQLAHTAPAVESSALKAESPVSTSPGTASLRSTDTDFETEACAFEARGETEWPAVADASSTDAATSKSGWIPGSSWAPLDQAPLLAAEEPQGESRSTSEQGALQEGQSSLPEKLNTVPQMVPVDTWQGWGVQTTSNGELFFFHRKRGISQWELPLDLSDVLGVWQQVPGLNGEPGYWCNTLLQLATWHDPRSITTIFQAAYQGDLFFADLFIKAQGNVNLIDTSGRTALHLAASSAAAEAEQIVGALLEGCANIDARDVEGYTPLHWASRCKRPEIVRRLLVAGADSSSQNASGDTPAHLAVEAHSTAALTALLDHKADISTRSHSRGMRTPLELAVAQGTQDLASLLRKSTMPVPKVRDPAARVASARQCPVSPAAHAAVTPLAADTPQVPCHLTSAYKPPCDVAAWRRASTSMCAMDNDFCSTSPSATSKRSTVRAAEEGLEAGFFHDEDALDKETSEASTPRAVLQLLHRLVAQLRRAECSRSQAYELGHGVPLGSEPTPTSHSLRKLLGVVANLPGGWRPLLEPIFFGLRAGMDTNMKARDTDTGLP